LGGLGDKGGSKIYSILLIPTGGKKVFPFLSREEKKGRRARRGVGGRGVFKHQKYHFTLSAAKKKKLEPLERITRSKVLAFFELWPYWEGGFPKEGSPDKKSVSVEDRDEISSSSGTQPRMAYTG